MATWTIGGETYSVTDEQYAALEGLGLEFTKSVDDEFERLRRTDPRYDGHHIGNAPDPFKRFAIEYYEKVCAVLGLEPTIASI